MTDQRVLEGLGCFRGLDLAAQTAWLRIHHPDERQYALLARDLQAGVKQEVEYHVAVDGIACQHTALARVGALLDAEHGYAQVLPLSPLELPDLGADLVLGLFTLFTLSSRRQGIITRGRRSRLFGIVRCRCCGRLCGAGRRIGARRWCLFRLTEEAGGARVGGR